MDGCRTSEIDLGKTGSRKIKAAEPVSDLRMLDEYCSWVCPCCCLKTSNQQHAGDISDGEWTGHTAPKLEFKLLLQMCTLIRFRVQARHDEGLGFESRTPG